MLRLIERPGEWRPSGPIVRAEEFQALLDAEGLIAEAKGEAERLRAEAVAEFERQKAEGRAEGLRLAKEEASERLIASVAETIRGFRAVETKLVAVVDKAVRKIVGDLSPRERVAGLVRTALAGLASEGKAKVRVAAEDLEGARSALVRPETGELDAAQFVEIAPDPRLLPGSCVIETEHGIIDAALDVQLKAVARALRKAALADEELSP